VSGTLLHVSASARRDDSLSRRAGRELVGGLTAVRPSLRVVGRDLAEASPPHPSAAFVHASLKQPAERGPDDVAALEYSETLIAELEAADIVVIDTPMHNFTVPSALKAWLDHVVRPQRTFGLRPHGKVGLLRDRPVFVVIACGARCHGEGAQEDFLTPYLRYVLGTIGLSRVDVLRLDGLRRGDAQVAAAFASGRDWMRERAAALT
jgi:FMN-dependent NADH-azoreductase